MKWNLMDWLSGAWIDIRGTNCNAIWNNDALPNWTPLFCILQTCNVRNQLMPLVPATPLELFSGERPSRNAKWAARRNTNGTILCRFQLFLNAGPLVPPIARVRSVRITLSKTPLLPLIQFSITWTFRNSILHPLSHTEDVQFCWYVSHATLGERCLEEAKTCVEKSMKKGLGEVWAVVWMFWSSLAGLPIRSQEHLLYTDVRQCAI